MIRFESVTKTYPDGTVAVDGLDLEAPTGKLTILVGPSTALSLLRTLESRESIRRDVDGRFTPGARLVQLGTLALANESLVSLAGGTMRRMVEQTGESCDQVARIGALLVSESSSIIAPPGAMHSLKEETPA